MSKPCYETEPIIVLYSTLNVTAKRETSEATCRDQYACDQRRLVEAEACDHMRYAQFISGGRRRRCPPYCLAHTHPTMRCYNFTLDILVTIFPHIRAVQYKAIIIAHLLLHSTT